MLVTPMRPHEHTDVPSLFWERVRRSRHRLLMLDYDGTLAPFRLERSQALIPAATRAVLQRLLSSRTTRIAIISGRQVSELERLIGPLPVDLVGEHGWEARSADGRTSRHRLTAEAAMRLEQASRAARASGWGPRLERKRCSLVLHTRGLPLEAARELEFACERLWRTYYERDGLRLHPIDGGLTLRAVGRHKGTAVAELIAGSPPDTLSVYLGDDTTDEDAFHELLDCGVTIHVGTMSCSSTARFHLGSTDDVGAFLSRWEEVARATTEDDAAAGEPDASSAWRHAYQATS
jgi:trehalose 6-phosphate phosphatase